jgi:hypothetical protein
MLAEFLLTVRCPVVAHIDIVGAIFRGAIQNEATEIAQAGQGSLAQGPAPRAG